MGTRLRKVVLYVLDLNDPMSEESLKAEFESMRYVDFVKVDSIETADIGQWHDDHPLNKKGGDFEAYFKK